MINDIYNTAILTLSAGIEHLGALENPDGTASKTARLCGSKIQVDVCVDTDEKISKFAQNVKACALGQAAAAILGKHVIGASLSDIAQARDDLWALLKDNTPIRPGRFDELQKLAGIADYPARHASTCLAFDAALAAMEMAVGDA